VLDILNKKNQKYYICGDFNINLLKYNIAANITDYMNSVVSMGCNMLVDKPTRITSNAATCLDHVYSNITCNLVDNYVVTADISDHFGTFSKINELSVDETHHDIYYRKSTLNEKEWNGFKTELNDTLQQFPTNPETSNVNEMANKITKTYQTLINKYMPLRKMSNKKKKNPDKPWITPGLKKSIQNKAKLHTKAKKTSNTVDWQNYKAFQTVLTRTKRKAEQLYYRDLSILYGQDKSKT